MKRPSLLIAASLFAGSAGCAGSAAVQGDSRLPVRNVVLYRSGVGYFERSGTFAGEALQFRVKQSEVGDFLASLTAVERSAGGVRSVSFEVPEPVEPAPLPSPDDKRPAPEPPVAPADPRVDVKLSFAAKGEHELSVAYVVGSPVWRPSYRVVFDDAGKPLLQAWAVVQNTSGEDWRNVKLTLTTGAPISFRSDLGTPITPNRPLVTDSGEVVDYVPTGETVIAQGAAPPAPPAPEAMMDELAGGAVASEAAAPMKKEYAKSARAAKPQAAPAPAITAQNLSRSVQAQAVASAVSETVTRYELSQPVTVPNGGSTMVAIVSTQVSGEQARLFAPEGGVALSSTHPFAVARLRNDTGAVLERGPISVLAHGSFLGQGVIDTLPQAAQTFVPFALDKSIVVEPSEHWEQTQGQLVRVQRGLVTVQQFSQRKTVYHLRNGGAVSSTVYVRHPRWMQAELLAPPAGTELAPDKALLPVAVAARGEATLEVLERTPTELQLSVLDARAMDAIGLWLSGPAASDPQSAQLAQALSLSKELASLDAQLGSDDNEQNELAAALDETRQNLKAIEKLASAKDLRTRLYERLKVLDARSAELTKRLIEGRTRRAELEVRLKESLEGVTLEGTRQ
jgi:Domain of unknown function (DUF4139)